MQQDRQKHGRNECVDLLIERNPKYEKFLGFMVATL